MDDLIGKELAQKAEEDDVPAGAWKQVQEQIRPVRRARFWQRYHRDSMIHIVATVAVLFLLVSLGAMRPAAHNGADRVVATNVPLTVQESGVAVHQLIGDDLLKLRVYAPLSVQGLAGRNTASSRVEKANAKLSPFGYRLAQASNGHFDMYHGDDLILSGVSNFTQVTVSERNDDFILMAFNPADRYWLVRAAGAQEWSPAEVSRHRFQPPVYVQNELVEVEMDDQTHTYVVKKGGQMIFTVPLTKPAFGNEIKRLASWSGHWVLEVDGDVYIDGESLAQRLSYDEVFEWRLLADRPFYLFRKESQVGVSFDGHTLPYQYNKVPHNLCCEPSALNPLGDEVRVQFYGLRSEMWYVVEVRALEGQ